MSTPSLRFSKLPGQFAVCRLSSQTAVPDWAFHGQFLSVTRTEDELSIVCELASVPNGVNSEPDWAGLKLQGPFPFDQAGVLASFISPLAERDIPIFAISTFDTDYVFVKSTLMGTAIETLRTAGHELIALS